MTQEQRKLLRRFFAARILIPRPESCTPSAMSCASTGSQASSGTALFRSVTWGCQNTCQVEEHCHLSQTLDVHGLQGCSGCFIALVFLKRMLLRMRVLLHIHVLASGVPVTRLVGRRCPTRTSQRLRSQRVPTC